MTRRSERLDSELRKEIASILSGEVKNRNPGMKGIISVTEVDVAPDLKTAKAYVSVYAADEGEKARTFAVITESAGLVRRELARVMRTRTVPMITFLPDNSMEYGSKMDELLAKLHEEDPGEHD